MDQVLESCVGELGGGGDPLDLAGLLDRPQAFDRAASGDKLGAPLEQLTKPAVISHRRVGVVESEPRRAARQQFGQQLNQLLRRAHALELRVDLCGRLLDIAEIGDESAPPGAEQGESVAAAVAGEIAEVDEVADQQQIDPGRSSSPSSRSQRSRSSAQLRAQHLERLTVAVGAFPRDPPEAELGDHRAPAPLLAGVDVGEVDLDGGQRVELKRIADRVGVVRPGTRVQHDASHASSSCSRSTNTPSWLVWNRVSSTPSLGERFDPALQLGEREASVVLGVAAAELVKVDAVHHLDPQRSAHDQSSSSTAARSSP